MRIAQRATPSPIPTPYTVPPSQKFDGNDGSWSTFKISVGTPGQDFRVLASTQSGETYVIVPDGCMAGDGPDCPNQRGVGLFGSTQSPGFQVNVSSSWSTIGQYDADVESRLNITAQGFFGYDKIALGPAANTQALSLDRQVIAGVAELNYYLGHLPLGVPASSFSSLSQSIDSFMYQLRNGSKIPSLSFGYTAGAKYRLKSVFGNLILGGYDSTRFTPNAAPFSFSFATDPSRLLTVGVDSITALNTLKGTYSLSSGPHFSLIDSTVPHLWLPRAICDSFEQAFGLTYDPKTDLYLVNDTIHAQLKSKNPSITIKLVNSLKDTSVNYTNIVLPYGAFDLQASYPYYQNATNYFPIRRATNDTQYVLGRTLLQEAYLIVDYERANFTVAQAAFIDPLPAAQVVTIQSLSSTSSTSPGSSKSKLGTGAIAAIAAIGTALLILAVGAVVMFIIRRRKSNSNSKRAELDNSQISDTTSSAAMIGGSQKVDFSPQELGGTPLTELASPINERKAHISPTSVPQELPAPLSRPTWQEVTAREFYGMEADSTSASQMHSRATSVDERRTRTDTSTFDVSPLTQAPR